MTNTRCSLTTAVATMLVCATWFDTLAAAYPQASPPAAAQIQAAVDRTLAHQADGRMGEHVAEMEEAVRQAGQVFGPEGRATAQVLNVLAMVYEAKGREDDALATYRKALTIAETDSMPLNNDTYLALHGLGQILLKKSKPAEAVPMFERAMKIVEARFGLDHVESASIQTSLARAYLAVARPADAVALARRALKAIEGQDGPDAPSTILIRNTLAMSLEGLTRYDAAEKLYKQSLAIADAKLPVGHPSSLQAANDLGHLYQTTGRAAEAEPLIRRVTQGRPAGPNVNTSEDATVLNNQATALHQAGRLAEAVTMYQRALALSEVKNGSTHMLTIGILGNLSEILKLMARLGEAETYALRALDAREKAAMPDDLPSALCRKNLGEIYLMTGRHGEAEPQLRQALAIIEGLEGPDHIDAVSVLHGLACVYSLSARFKESVDLDCRALAIVESKLGSDSRLAGSVLLVLGGSYSSLRRYELAERHLRRAVDILERHVGTEHSDTAAARNNLATVLMATNRAVEAAELFRVAADATEKRFGPDHPGTANALSNLALAQVRFGRWAEALETYDKCRHIRRRFIERTLPGLAEDDQFALLSAGEREDLCYALTMGLARRDDPSAAALSAAWVVNAKGVALEALAQRAVLAREATSTQTAAIAADLKAVQRRLAESGAPRPGQPVPTEGYGQLVVREKDLSRRLGLALNRPVREDPWVTIPMVRAKLPADAVLIEFARFRVAGISSETGVITVSPERYAVWVISPVGRGDVRLIDLGPAAAIDEAVSEVAHGITIDQERLDDQGEPTEEKRLMPALEKLSRLVLGPLRTMIDPAKRWVISPDSSLWVVPWAALPVDPGVYAIERHLIHLVVSGRELAAAEAPAAVPGGTTPPAIFADPDFDFDLASTSAPSALPAAPPDAGPGLSVPRGWSLSEPLIRLKYSGREAVEVAPPMGRYAGVNPGVYLRAAASEAAFKQLRSPRALLLSTHGDFRDNPDTGPGQSGNANATANATRTVATDGLPANPLLRCALLFAGVNKRVGSSAPPFPGQEDGVLTGLEIVGSDLRGTDLVVLSACKTGRGEIRAGEGVAGLRQAFQIAGAPTVVSSLWSVDDRATATLVAAFFDNLSNGDGPATSLRRAQLRQIAERRTEVFAAHPFFWAAFSVTGRPGSSWATEPVDSVAPASLTPATGSKALGSLVTRGLESSEGILAKSDVEKGPGRKAAGLWPGADREGRDHPMAEGALLTLAIVATFAISRWWWLGGQSGRS